MEGDSPSTSARLFGRQRSVHEILGGGKFADIVLWKKKHVSAGLLAGATVAYILFEYCGYTLLSILSNALLFLVVILFAWSNVAAFLDRSPPPIPEVQLSEDMVESISQTLRLALNRALKIVHDVALGKDIGLLIQVMASLWLFSFLSGWCHCLTLLYLVMLAPLIYDKYEDDIDHHVKSAVKLLGEQYTKVNETIVSKIPRNKTATDEGKKAQ